LILISLLEIEGEYTFLTRLAGVRLH